MQPKRLTRRYDYLGSPTIMTAIYAKLFLLFIAYRMVLCVLLGPDALISNGSPTARIADRQQRFTMRIVISKLESGGVTSYKGQRLVKRLRSFARVMYELR